MEDAYTYYVLVLGVPADVFWNCDCAFVKSVAANKSAYEAWLGYAREQAREKEAARYRRR